MKRHRWGEEKFSGSMVQHKWTSTCQRCGGRRERHFDYGQHRNIYFDASPHGGAYNHAPECQPVEVAA